MAQNPVNGAKSNNHLLHVVSSSSGSSDSDGNSPYGNENIDFSYAVLNFINDVLMEEDVEGRPCMLQDCLALQAKEKAFYDVLTQNYDQQENVAIQTESQKKVWKHTLNTSWGNECSEEMRKNKHLAMAAEDSYDEHMFDEVFLVKTENGVPLSSCPLYEASQNRAANTRRPPAKKQAGNEKEMVDLWSLLSQCAQAVAVYDQRSATELLGKIRHYSSPYGDGTERLAYYFAKGLEIRLSGTRAPLFTPISTNATLAADVLKAHILYVSVCPFKRISNLFSNRNIAKLAEKATTIHIIDFGIGYGFQWPCLIQRLSTRTSGPPKLRITGIDFPQPGFRPAERIEVTGRRLRRCCENVGMPFEFNAIAKRWETIRAEELKIERDELIVVNCMYRLRNLPDDSVMLNSPRNMVLKLIKKINPDLFIHGVVNGNYNVTFFNNRFKEAFYHFSAMFDILEANVGGEDPDRLLVEREMFGRDAINVITCEGTERIDRPETYKQWQLRNKKAGFRQLPLEQRILKRARTVLKSDYHKDFDIEVDGRWMLQGWKGRVIHALSCWKPVQD
ncbi:Scarecrow-like protein 9 [Hibiscus syriacus]|uniref:Scarecrow-like protein 9 n=1 Tax=Hibiscus syriacus TaxID=106335 RepID=A0A6A3CQP1_HIBSY|nr:scarecrow-like protein 30 [Hibiscus syriacus]KAE8729468.1 Scarecrow-like protein 9 [Hibiscus syriacus]